MRTINVIAILILLLTLNACELGFDFINPAGPTREVERSFNGKITKVSLYDDVKVTVRFTDGEQYATVRAGKNIIDNVKTTLSDSILTIRNETKATWSSSYENKKEVTLYLNNTLTSITYYGVEDLTFLDTIKVPSFDYYCDNSAGKVKLALICNTCNINQHSGVSDLVISGKCDEASVYYKGSGWIYLQEFVTPKMDVTNNGSGDISINVTATLLATIKSIGNIKYIGSPQITLVKEGKGNLKQ